MPLIHFAAQLAMLASLQAPPAPTAPMLESRVGISSEDDSTVLHRRPRAIQISDAYATRLTIHRYGSYVMLPLFAAQYVMGSRLLKQRQDIFSGKRTQNVDDGLRRAHKYTAIGVGALFVINTTTGAWNLYDNRKNPDHRAIRTVHALTMLLSDAGFVATGRIGLNALNKEPFESRRHRTFALTSMGIATVGASMMWLFDH
jgi:hypothetical protein